MNNTNDYRYNNNIKVIKLKKAYSIEDFESLENEIKGATTDQGFVQIDAQHLSTVDLSFVQVLMNCAFNCEKKGGQLEIHLVKSDHPLKLFCDKIGFSKFKFI